MEANTKLGSAIAQASAPASSRASAGTRLQAALAGHRVFKPVAVPIVPGVELAAVMTLVGSERHLDVEGEVATAMERRGLEQNVLNQGKFELAEAIIILAESVLDSETNPVPIGSVKDWGRLSPEVLGDLWMQYGELRAQHDPAIAELTQEEADAISDAVEKKNGGLLRYFGARRLSVYLLTSADRRASSSTERSPPGDSSPGA